MMQVNHLPKIKKQLMLGIILVSVATAVFLISTASSHKAAMSGPYNIQNRYEVGDTVIASATQLDPDDRGFIVFVDGSGTVQRKFYFSGLAGPKEVQFPVLDLSCNPCTEEKWEMQYVMLDGNQYPTESFLVKGKKTKL